MGDLSITVLAAEEGGQSNFLLPNGTFIFVLLIFLIVLGVIAKFVVPPVSAVLHEREAMVTKTDQDNRKSAELSAAAQDDSAKVMGEARREASSIRDQARTEGREILEDMRSRANEEVTSAVQKTNEELSRQGRQTADELRSSIETLSETLAGRVLGTDVASSRTAATTSQGR
ncbi:F0F1 ATP synthase subunit B [Mycolicibacterium duvalii]|uniref:ATP synthase subunit b n=1 Tax=Mycolicibacterium duvalii TaxID=39688 RepID=A0A7I7JUD2_9MYCO|nr:F0F1 ATP synthase subunit B [Mycolicibacterium duvalii]MCV7369292.1 F0F1 ATP synthase subunit B [Mycolicibacterium duvalii]PEG35395.1 F0F1 ATP synthase subunit B [Mycolicibacterium duvalii]BBX15476.1 ATP synthase subunit b [Mycolicibacterium duvalii]